MPRHDVMALVPVLRAGEAIVIRFSFFLIIFTLVGNALAPAQAPAPTERDRGIVFAQGENPAEAIRLLTAATKQDKKDIRAWHWLGIAFEKQQKVNDALKAHEKAAKVADELHTSLIERSASLLKLELVEAADSAERFLSLNSGLSDKKRKEWRDRADFLRVHAGAGFAERQIYKSGEVNSRARVLRKPEPAYTEAARNNQITGTVVLRCVFGADGMVRNLFVVKGLPDGLSERAIEAARKIKFIPALKDGRPVSMWMQLEYNFNLY